MENINPIISQAIITLGGKGTRLSDISKGFPKSLLPVNGMNTFERAIKILSEQGIKKFTLLLNYKSDLFIKEAEFNKKKYGIDFSFFEEKTPCGEAGALLKIKEDLDQEFLFVHGDIIFDIDLNRFFEFHIKILQT